MNTLEMIGIHFKYAPQILFDILLNCLHHGVKKVRERGGGVLLYSKGLWRPIEIETPVRMEWVEREIFGTLLKDAVLPLTYRSAVGLRVGVY